MEKPNLLLKLDACEYPADYLVARLQGKRRAFLRSWEFLIASSDPAESLQGSPFYPCLKQYGAAGIRRFLHDEHLWVYARMNKSLRILFTPYFAYHEMAALIACFRHLHGRSGTESISQHLHSSLLHSEIQKILTANLDFPVMLARLETYLGSVSRLFHGLSEYRGTKELSIFEMFLREKMFAWIFSRTRSPLLKTFFHAIVDFHNCMTLAKSLRWQLEALPVFISGGTVGQRSLRNCFARRNLVPLLNHFHLENPDGAASSVTRLENALLGCITKQLKRNSFQKTIVGDILFYLWEQFRHVRNISMILHTLRLDDETVRENIVTA